MAYTRHFCPELNFVLTECTGSIDDQTLLVHFMSFRNEATGFMRIRELVDLRMLRKYDKLTVKGLIQTAQKHKELFMDKELLSAILVNSNEYAKMAQFYASLANSSNFQIKVFQEGIDEALIWLGYAYEDRSKLRSFIRRRTGPVKYIQIDHSS